MSFAYEERVHLIWAALAIVGVLAWLELRGRGSLGALLSPVMRRRLVVRTSVARTITRLALFLAFLIASVVALMRPQAGGETISLTGGKVAGDVVILLDVSKSMLATDAKPNRIERAKSQIEGMASQLSTRLPGIRLGLVAFAGRAAMLCPLTTDQAFYDLVLQGVDTGSVSRGGTRIGDAIRTAVKSFPDGAGAKLIVLITDGEDHESGPLDAAKEAADAGVRIVAVGIGSEEGSPITITDPKTNATTELLKDGAPVISKLDGDTLRQIAATTDGVYVPAGTAMLDLPSIVKEHIQPMVAEETAKATKHIPNEQYRWAIAAAIAALLAVAALGGIRRRA